MAEVDDWVTPPKAAPPKEDDWAAPGEAAKPPAVGSRESPIDSVEHDAGAGTIARVSLAPDDKVKIRRYAEAFKQSVDDFETTKDGHIIRKLPGTDTYARVQASVSGSKDPLDAAKRAFGWVSSGVGPAIPAVASAVAMLPSVLAAPETGGASLLTASALGAAGAGVGETARQKLDAMLADDGIETEMDYGNIAMETAAGAAGPLLGKAVTAAMPYVKEGVKAVGKGAMAESGMVFPEMALEGAAAAAPAATAVTAKSLGLSQAGLAALEKQIAAHRAEAELLEQDIAGFRERGAPIDLSVGQKTGSHAQMQEERQLIRDKSTVQQVMDLRELQNETQIPGVVRNALDDISPAAHKSAAIEPFREASDHVVKKEIGERSDMADYLYEPLFQGKSIAPLEDQLRTAVMKATAEKGQIAKEMSKLQKLHPGAISGSAKPINPAAQAKNAEIKAQYDELSERASQVEEARVSFLDRFNKAKADKTADAPGAVWTPRIQEFLDDPIGKAGLARGMEIQRLEALEKRIPFKPSDYAIVGMAEDGVTPIVGSVPNLRLLNAWKKGLDAIIESETVEGRLTERGKAVFKVKKEFLKEVDDIVPEYGVARAQFGTDSDAINAIKEGGVGLLNRMKGEDRQGMIKRIFSGERLIATDVAEMRKQFIYAGKINEWNAALRSHVEDVMVDAIKNTDEAAGNLGKKLHKTLFRDKDQLEAIRAALGDNTGAIERWESLGRVLNAAKHQLAEGAATATDLPAAGALKHIATFFKMARNPESIPGEVLSAAAPSKKLSPDAAQKLAAFSLTPEGDKVLRQMILQTPASPKAMSLLSQMLVQAGVVGAAGE